jgi:hypothetical protein
LDPDLTLRLARGRDLKRQEQVDLIAVAVRQCGGDLAA